MAREDSRVKMHRMEQWAVPGHGHFKGAGDRTFFLPVKKQ